MDRSDCINRRKRNDSKYVEIYQDQANHHVVGSTVATTTTIVVVVVASLREKDKQYREFNNTKPLEFEGIMDATSRLGILKIFYAMGRKTGGILSRRTIHLLRRA